MRDRIRQFVQLFRLFYARFLENDLICVDADTRPVLIGLVSLLVGQGVFLPFVEFLQFGSYPLSSLQWYQRDMVALPHKILHIAFSMTVLGLFTIVEWDALLPDRRDLAVLRPLPVAVTTLFAARLAALFAFWAVLTLAVDGFSGVFFPVAVLQKSSLDILAWYIWCHAVALVLGNLFMFFALIAVQGVLIALLGWGRFRRVAPFAQFVLIVAVLGHFFVAMRQVWRLDIESNATGVMALLPVWWFFGLDQVMLGWRNPLFTSLADVASRAVMIAGVLAGAGYAISYRRALSRAFEEASTRVSARRVNSLSNFEVKGRAAFWFVIQTVARSRPHRMVMAAWTAVGVAIVLQAITGAMAVGNLQWWSRPAGPLLAVPVVIPLFLVLGLRYAFTIPSDLRANWVFQCGVSSDPRVHLQGARQAARVLVMLPLAVILGGTFVWLWGWMLGGLHALFGVVVGWLLIESVMVGFDKVPFTCSYVPGKANIKCCWPLYVYGYVGFVGALSWLELKILEQPGRVVWLLVGATLIRVGLERYRRSSEDGDSGQLVFDERPEPAVFTLGQP